jgi:predicted Zn-dependent peptidase
LVREKLGGAYYINSSIESFFDRGIFVIKGGIDSSRAELILTEIVKEIKSLKEKLIAKEELEKVKNYIVGKLFMQMDQPYALKNYLTLPTLYNKKVRTPKEELEKILKISVADVQQMANKIFTKENINLAMVTSLEKEKEFKNIINQI